MQKDKDAGKHLRAKLFLGIILIFINNFEVFKYEKLSLFAYISFFTISVSFRYSFAQSKRCVSALRKCLSIRCVKVYLIIFSAICGRLTESLQIFPLKSQTGQVEILSCLYPVSQGIEH